MSSITSDLRYPIGKYIPVEYSEKQKEEWLADIQFLPNALESAIHNLNEEQIHTPYREGGWTIQQLVHHVADSHMNAFIRFKLGMTEDNPTIKPYHENLWAQHADVANVPINISITLLFALHHRWHEFLKSLSAEQLQERTIYHPEHQKQMTLWYLLGMYSWHGRHHVAHIHSLRERKGW